MDETERLQQLCDDLDLKSRSWFARVSHLERPLAVFGGRYIVTCHDPAELKGTMAIRAAHGLHTLLIWDGHTTKLVAVLDPNAG